MSFLLGILIFVLAMLFSIMLHEAGHFATAKKFGMKVTQFFVGFGQTLWSTRRGETEYGVKAIPAGGFVKIVGMLPPGPDAPHGRPRTGSTGVFSQLVSDARRAEYEHADP